MDFPRVFRRLPCGDVLDLADGEVVVAGMGRPPLGVPPEVLLNPHLHCPHLRASHLPK